MDCHERNKPRETAKCQRLQSIENNIAARAEVWAVGKISIVRKREGTGEAPIGSARGPSRPELVRRRRFPFTN